MEFTFESTLLGIKRHASGMPKLALRDLHLIAHIALT